MPREINTLRKSEVRLRIAGHLFRGFMTERGTALYPEPNLLFHRHDTDILFFQGI